MQNRNKKSVVSGKQSAATKEKPLPCPFCGGKAKLRLIPKEDAAPEIPSAYWVGECGSKGNCPAMITVFGDTKEAAISQWNTRHVIGAWIGEDRRTLQPIALDEQGIARFRKNKIVCYLLDDGAFDMNHLANLGFSASDRSQFAQLIGYSVSGFGELSYTADDQVEQADKIAASLSASPRLRGEKKGGAK